MKKNVIKNKIVLVVFLFLVVSAIFNPSLASARVETTTFNTTKTGMYCGDSWDFLTGYTPPYWCTVTVSNPGKQIIIGGVKESESSTVYVGGVSFAKIATPSYDSSTCTADPRIKQFCVDIIQCRTDSTCVEGTDPTCASDPTCANKVHPVCAVDEKCGKATMEVYDKKMTDILQAEIDEKIDDVGLDKDKANDAIESCGGDLSCIDKVLANLQKDSNYVEGSAPGRSTDDPLTAGGLSDLINSDGNGNTGPTNSAANDQSGLLGKTPGPKVEVTFSTSGSGQIGSKMSATAIPSFFNSSSDPKKLYFTWYLKRNGCEARGSGVPVNDPCNLDGNDKIDVNDWKIAAAKIIVTNSFDNTEANYANFPTGIDASTAGYKSVPSPKSEWSINSGADENISSASNCYVQAPKSGHIYELRKAKSTFDNSCLNGYHRACVSNQTAQCDVLNPLFKQSDADAAAASVPPTIYSILKKSTNDFKACAVSSEESDNSDAICSVRDDAALKNFKANVVCKDENTVPICLKDDNLNEDLSSNAEFKDNTGSILGVIVGTGIGTNTGIDDNVNNKMCNAVGKPDPINEGLFLDNTKPLITENDEQCATIQSRLINGTKDDLGKVITEGNLSLAPKCSFEKDVNLCKHLFPILPGDVKANNGNRAVTGDGEFNLEEKKFWGADPTRASTNGAGKDEENVVGLGVDKFDWMFTIGDQVGVVVEGESTFQSEHPNDSSYKRMWAFSKGTCKALDNMEKNSIDNENPDNNTRGFYVDGSKGILTAEVDLNSCLKENLLDPSGNDTSELTVQLNASPANPINDPDGKGDILNIASTAVNTQNSSGLLYDWSVQKSMDGSDAPIDTTRWMDITTKMENEGAFSASDREGLDKKDLDISLILPESVISDGITPESKYRGVFYLKIRVKITGATDDGNQGARGEVIVKVKQQENEMRFYPVIATSEGMLNLNKGASGRSLELCGDQQGKIICYVSKNAILGLEVPNAGNNNLSNFSWTANGNPIACSADVSSECSPGGNKIFVPVLGNAGEAVDIVATALNEKNESIEVSRHFMISQAELQITALVESPENVCSLECLNTNSACKKYLGAYKDLDGTAYPDCSEQVWQTSEGKTVKLSAQGQMGLEWEVDGEIMPEYQNQNQIELIVNKLAGDSYNISLSTHLRSEDRAQLSGIRKALFKNWGVAPEEEVIAENQSANIQLDVVSGSSEALAASKSNFFGASLITHLPEQLMFLLKISLTSILMILTAGLLFAFIPETLFREEK